MKGKNCKFFCTPAHLVFNYAIVSQWSIRFHSKIMFKVQNFGIAKNNRDLFANTSVQKFIFGSKRPKQRPKHKFTSLN